MDVVIREDKKTFKCDRSPIFQVTNLNINLAQLRPSEIHYLPNRTAQNDSLGMWQPEYQEFIISVFDHLKSNLEK